MTSLFQKLFLTLSIAIYAFLGLSPTAPHVMTSDMMQSHSGMASMDAHNAHHSCHDQTCIQPAQNTDCLEACLEAASQTTDDNIIITTFLFFAALVAAVITTLPALTKQRFFRPREWFRPIYHFDTTQLRL